MTLTYQTYSGHFICVLLYHFSQEVMTHNVYSFFYDNRPRERYPGRIVKKQKRQEDV